MLRRLTLSNFGVFETAEASIGKGLTVITGETGAGKSTLVEALRVLAGHRFPGGMALREGASSFVEGEFDLPPESVKWWQSQEIEVQNPVIIRRQRLPSGRTRTFIDDQPVPLNVLQETPRMLLDIHSQHQALWLKRPDFHLEVLDAFARSGPLLDDYRQHYQRYRRLLAEKERLLAVPDSEDADYVRFLYEELSAVNLDADAFRQMEEALERLEHREQILQGLQAARDALTEGEDSAADRLAAAEEALAEAARYDGTLRELKEMAGEAARQVQELALRIDQYGADADLDGAEAEQWRQWRDAVYRLMLKHRVQDVEELTARRDELAERLQLLESRMARMAEVEADLQRVQKELEAAAVAIRAHREAHREGLAEKITALLVRLAMPAATVSVEMEPAADFRPSGKDRVRLLFSANKGMPPAPLEKTASGGEVSRLMLAVKYILSEEQEPATLVLDEIDAGISGEAAGRVADLIAEMGRRRQVIVVSHSPQTAALPGVHLHVEKHEHGGRTSATIRQLTPEERVEEIARLIAGNRRTEEARSVAVQLLGRNRG